jgi:uncharacterized membrane protein YedE/YeeE
MHDFTPWSSTAGGLLIGLAVSGFYFLNGRIAGISGIAAGALAPKEGGRSFRLFFFAGLIAGGMLLAAFRADAFERSSPISLGAIAIAGVCVGLGTQIGGGCTSGHGICGIARRSPRSVAATAVFMAAGALAAWFTGRLVGGAA